MLSTARLLGQTSGAALVATIFLLTPLRGTAVSVAVAAGFALVGGGRQHVADQPGHAWRGARDAESRVPGGEPIARATVVQGETT